MSDQNHRWFAPSAQLDVEILEIYQTTHQFYEEAYYREERDRYIEWYRNASRQHRQELEKMRGDINLFGWFCRKGMDPSH